MTDPSPGNMNGGIPQVAGTGRFPRYPAYKDSDVERLGEMPAHWEVRLLKQIGDLQAGAGFPDAFQEDTSQQIPFFKVGDMATSANAREMRRLQHTVSQSTAKALRAYVFPPGTIVFAKVGAALLLNRRRMLVRPSCIDNNMMGFIPRGCDPQWAMYWLNGLDMGGLANPGAVPSVNEGQVRETPVLVPTDPEQRTIAAFLDRETAKIDALVAKKERLIELLQEKRTAIITRAVTKGLDPDVPMKDAGLKWLGEIPVHWEILALRRRWEIIDCKHVTVPFVDLGIPLASVRETQSFELNLSNARHTTCEWYAMLVEGKRSPRRGDLIYCRNVSVGSAAFVNSDERFAMGQDVCIIRSVWESQRWLNYYLCSNAMSNQLATTLVGSTFDRINVGEIRELIVPVPPRRQQDDIAAFLDCESAKLDALVDKVREAIERLKELRTALISAAVTGKIDVRETAA